MPNSSGVLSFAPGETSKTFTIPVLGDTTYEPDEIFQVQLSSPSNATLSGAAGVATVKITNDDSSDMLAPTLLGSTPADNATTVAVNSNITLAFSEAVQAGIGNIVISNGTDSRNISVADTSQVTISGSTVTINPAEDLTGGSNYYVQMANGVLKDLFGNGYVGIKDATTLNFTTQAFSSINLSALNGLNGFKIAGVPMVNPVTNNQLGSDHSMSSAGDINGDGFDDVIVGARTASPNGIYSGASYVVFGKAGGFSATQDTSSLNGNNGFSIVGEVAGDESGFAVSGAGDVNGDGLADLIIGAWKADSNGSADSGASYVLFGKSAGFNSNVNLSSLNGSTGFKISSTAAKSQGGFSVSGAGDVNGDGFSDLLPTRLKTV